MRVLYFDCFAGVSGDMTIAALIDLGIDVDSLKRQLSSLGLSGYQIRIDRVERSGIAATKFDVLVDSSPQPARHLADIREIIARGNLSELARSRSIQAFERLAEAEARAHGTTIDKVHFHEVGAIDSIIDVVGAMIGVEMLGVDSFFSSSLRVGYGTVKAAHGLLPVPAPGTAEILRGAPIYAGQIEGEFVTPTGAAIVTTLCESFGPLPALSIERIGYGAGSRNPEGFPNALRLVVGELSDQTASEPENAVVVIETNIDDMNPQVYEHVLRLAFKLGALDAFITPVQMKKSRPGVLLTILCEPALSPAVIDMLLAETTTLGVRYSEAKRRVLARTIETVETKYGSVRVKVARGGGRALHFQPEYEDCLRLAEAADVPLIEVQAAASAAYRKKEQLDGTSEEK
ncbi:MAG TPA: nickel pincer cofactor biosynthesis protein LarC [Blastocatellia bacterium]|nr:nickel pincer cofactor biosynthesis protein LarC [Blastocatellia bacterium]